MIRGFYRVFRWVSLVIFLVAIGLILHASPPPRIAITPVATQRAEEKVQEFQSRAQQGSAERLELNESELNGWLGANLALNRPDDANPNMPRTPESAAKLVNSAIAPRTAEDQAMLEQAKSSLRDVKMELRKDSMCVYATFDLHGIELVMELEGKITVQDGYLRLEPTRGKLGSLPLPSEMLQRVTTQLFDSPQNKDKFLLPSHIQDVCINHGQLIVTSR